jgi:hypothetical protein
LSLAAAPSGSQLSVPGRGSTNTPAPERRSVWVMKFAVSACFRAETAGLSWTVASQTARYRDAAPRSVPAGTGRQIGYSLIAARSPVMRIKRRSWSCHSPGWA